MGTGQGVKQWHSKGGWQRLCSLELGPGFMMPHWKYILQNVNISTRI